MPRTSETITMKMAEDAKQLLSLMGLPVVQAMADGEAQAVISATRRCMGSCFAGL